MKKPKLKKSKTNGLNFDERKELDDLPNQIDGWETKVAEIDEILSDPSTYSDSNNNVVELQLEKKSLESKIELALERWEFLSESAND